MTLPGGRKRGTSEVYNIRGGGGLGADKEKGQEPTGTRGLQTNWNKRLVSRVHLLKSPQAPMKSAQTGLLTDREPSFGPAGGGFAKEG